MIFGPVRSFVGTVRTNIFHFSENFEWTLYFFNFSKFWSVPRTGPTKIRTENPDHGPDQQISDRKSGTVRPSMIMISSLVPLVVVQELSWLVENSQTNHERLSESETLMPQVMLLDDTYSLFGHEMVHFRFLWKKSYSVHNFKYTAS